MGSKWHLGNSLLPNLGYGYNMTTFNHPTPSGSRPVDPILFISASELGSAWDYVEIRGDQGSGKLVAAKIPMTDAEYGV